MILYGQEMLFFYAADAARRPFLGFVILNSTQSMISVQLVVLVKEAGILHLF